MSVENKVVAISGTNSGIGRTLAEVFAARGAKVVGCARSVARGEKLQALMRERRQHFTYIPADVTKQADASRFVDAAVEEHGRIDVLINNAGGSGRWIPTDMLDEASFDATVRLNLYAPYFCAQRAIGHMKTSGGGVILSIASVHAVQAVARAAAYNAAKAGLVSFSNTVAVEFADHGIRSNIIMMGGAPTGGAAAAVRDATRLLKGEGAEPDFTQYLPRPLTGTPLVEIANALVALSGDDSKAITGATIAIDQGQSAGSLYSDAVFHALSGDWTAPAVAD